MSELRTVPIGFRVVLLLFSSTFAQFSALCDCVGTMSSPSEAMAMRPAIGDVRHRHRHRSTAKAGGRDRDRSRRRRRDEVVTKKEVFYHRYMKHESRTRIVAIPHTRVNKSWFIECVLGVASAVTKTHVYPLCCYKAATEPVGS